MKFIVGIGNPGEEYKNTRHNVGFRAIDVLKSVLKFDKDVLLVKPKTFVNRTGEAVASILDKHNAKSRDFLFVCDDVNLDFGKLRLREKGSAGGHHGLESVIEAMQTQDFPRLRIGVKNESMPKDLTDFVLEPFSALEKRDIGKILDKAASVCEAWIQKGFQAAQSRLSLLQSK